MTRASSLQLKRATDWRWGSPLSSSSPCLSGRFLGRPGVITGITVKIGECEECLKAGRDTSDWIK